MHEPARKATTIGVEPHATRRVKAGVAASPAHAALLDLQRQAGNRAVGALLAQVVQREPRRDDEDGERGRDRSRSSRPRGAPRGTVPIDESGLDRETIHKIKDAIGAAPDQWVGVTPDGHIVTGDGQGNVEDVGHISDYARSGAEQIPKWVWATLGFVAAIALIVLFATGVGEVAVIVAGLGTVTAAIILAALRAAGIQPSGPVASEDTTTQDTDLPA